MISYHTPQSLPRIRVVKVVEPMSQYLLEHSAADLAQWQGKRIPSTFKMARNKTT